MIYSFQLAEKEKNSRNIMIF